VITTHVLDTARGKPAAGVPISLELSRDGQWQPLGSGVTDDDGRLRTLTPAGPVAPGIYRIRFDTAAYFAATGAVGAATGSSGAGGATQSGKPGITPGVDYFFPTVEIVFVVAEGATHYHVPLLLSPFGYSTYRGS
jgi:5-hydroxyisourate hydrolase